MNRQRLLSIFNFISILIVIFYNYTVGVKGIHGKTVADMSDDYQTLFTPASYAFSIWGFIYLGLIALGIHQLYIAFTNKNENQIFGIGYYLIIANILNCLWIYTWLTDHTLLSVLIMIGILIALLTIVVRLKMQLYPASNAVKIWTWIPISLYVGWITVALIANVAAYLHKIGWHGWFSEQTWTIIMLIAAFGINVYMLLKRNMILFALVGVWSFTAIAVKHWNDNLVIEWCAISLTLFLLGFIFFQLYKREFKLL